MKSRIAAVSMSMLMLAAVMYCAAPGQSQAPTPIPFTLSWQANTTTDTTFALHSLLSYNGQLAASSVCGYSPEGYNVWCGEVVRYATMPAADFNFPDGFLLSGCSRISIQSSTTYTSPSRRTVTDHAQFECMGADGAQYTVNTTMQTKWYLAACRFRGCWQVFPYGQVPITGTVEQVTP